MLALASALAVATTGTAQTWDRGAGTNNWGDGLNWSTDTVPGAADSVLFNNSTLTGAQTISLGGTRSVTNVTFNTAAVVAPTPTNTYLLSAGVLNFSGQFLNQGGGNVTAGGGTELQGTGNMLLQRTLFLGEFGSFGARTNNFSGGTRITNGASLQLQYNGFSGTSFQYVAGTGAITFGTGLNNSTAGSVIWNQGGAARMTMANDFVNAVTRTGNFGNNQITFGYAGGVGETVAATNRLTGNFSTSAHTDGTTGHGWTRFRGRDINSIGQWSYSTYELSGDWSAWNPNSKTSFDRTAVVINSTASVGGAGSAYELNANSSIAPSTVFALGVNGVNFNRALSISNALSDNSSAGANGSNAANAVNQTYIGGRQAGTAQYSGAISFQRAGDHRLNLFSESGRTEFNGAISTGAGKVVAINSAYSMTTYTSIAASGQTQGDALTAFTPDGVVVFGGGTKTFDAGLEVVDGTLVINQAITGNTSVSGGAIIGSEIGGTITGNLSFADGAQLLFSNNTLTVSGTTTFAGTFGVADIIGLSSSTVAGTYTLIGGTVNFTNVINVGSDNAVDIGGGVMAYLQEGSLQLVVTAIPEPSTFAALAGLGVLGLAVVRRRRHGA